jgi:hypothetical protein
VLILCALATAADAKGVCMRPYLHRPVPQTNLPVNAHLWVQDEAVRLFGPSGEVPIATRPSGHGQLEVIPTELAPRTRYRLVGRHHTTELVTGTSRDTTAPLAPAYTDGFYALPVWPDTVVYEVTATTNPLAQITFAIAADDTRVSPVELRCSGLDFDEGSTVCFRVRAVDAAGNRSTPLHRCVTVDDDFYADSFPRCPSGDYQGLRGGGGAIAATMIASLIVFVLLLFATVQRWSEAVATAERGAPCSLPAAQHIARRLRGVAVIVIVACIASLAWSPWVIILCFWMPIFASLLAWRAHAALGADAATLHDHYVHLWKNGKLRAWLRVRPKTLAALSLPRARVTR